MRPVFQPQDAREGALAFAEKRVGGFHCSAGNRIPWAGIFPMIMETSRIPGELSPGEVNVPWVAGRETS
jgi:hypothetical protein